jgi:hypothetical protein
VNARGDGDFGKAACHVTLLFVALFSLFSCIQ